MFVKSTRFKQACQLLLSLIVAIFATFFFRQYSLGKCVYDILERKNASLGYKNKKFKKSENLHFSKEVNPWLLSRNGHFSNFFFSAIQARKSSFTIFQNKQTPFQAIKTKRLKIDNFPKELTHGFGPKMAIFPIFFYSIQARKSSFTIFQNKKTLSRL